jgi:hypothetical protein
VDDTVAQVHFAWQLFSQALCKCPRIFQFGKGIDDAEFVAPESRQHVGLPHAVS